MNDVIIFSAILKLLCLLGFLFFKLLLELLSCDSLTTILHRSRLMCFSRKVTFLWSAHVTNGTDTSVTESSQNSMFNFLSRWINLVNLIEVSFLKVNNIDNSLRSKDDCKVTYVMKQYRRHYRYVTNVLAFF